MRLALLYACMFVTGLSTIAFEAVIPRIMEFLSTNYAGIGNFTLVMSSAYMFTVLAAGKACDRRDSKGVMLLGLALISMAYAVFLRIPSYSTNLLLGLLVGGGSGIVAAAMNTMVLDVNPAKASSNMSYLHFFFAAGAILSPVLSVYTADLTGRLCGPFSLVGLLFAVLLLGFSMSGNWPAGLHGSDGGQGLRETLASRPLRSLAILIGMYVGIEVSIALWMTKFAVTLWGIGPMEAAWFLSVFWAGLCAGRLAVGKALSRSVPGKLLKFLCFGSLGWMLAGGAAIWLGSFSKNLAMPYTFVLGVFFSGHFPLIMAIGRDIAPASKGKIVGIFSASASVGAICGPWLVSVTAEFHGLSAGLSLTLLLMGVMALMLRVWAPVITGPSAEAS